MKKSTLAQLLIMGSISWSLQAAQAANVGMPLYEEDIEGKKGGVELYYEQYREDYIGHQQDYSMPTPKYDYVGSYYDELEADRFVARIDYYANKRFAFYAETGTTDFTDSKEKSFLFGAGLRAKVYAGSLFDVSLSASMTYIPEVTGEIYTPQTPLGDQYLVYEFSYYKLSGGLTVSRLIPLSAEWKIMPYGGVLVSDMFGDVDMEALLQSGGERRFFGMSDQRHEEDEPVSGFIGLGLMFNDTWGIRAEGQFGGQESYSGGLTCFF